MECDSYSDYSDDCLDYDYYNSIDNVCEELDNNSSSTIVNDPEYVEYSCLNEEQIKALIEGEVDAVSKSLSLLPSLAKILLCLNKWDIDRINDEISTNREKFLIENGIVLSLNSMLNRHKNLQQKQDMCQVLSSFGQCSICCENIAKVLFSLECNHSFCKNCWENYFDAQLCNGTSSKIECMHTDCRLICYEDFVLSILIDKPLLKKKYEHMFFGDIIASHPHLRACPSHKCNTVIYCKTTKPHRVTCNICNTKFCFLCGENYHAPASCEIIKKWLIKCADDSETANYISAHTKDCPNCHSCIEKNGGCNHMQCSKCKFHFCWMCFRDWKSHGSEYYECSRYKENPAIAQEANYLKARRALEKYLHYYERFENHNKSLKIEEEMRQRIKLKIEEKIKRHEGTWIDWQYLHSASHLLTKSRYTLQYTYPFAYFMESSARKELFEYQQAQLEKEIEELSWKVERAETTDRGDLENQMHIAEQKRKSLLQDFFN